jgi:benzodiazapine receptor
MEAPKLLGLAGWLGLSFVAAAFGAFASVNAASFYAGLNQPAWAPPAAVFGPVWTCLYLMMGIAAWLVWRERGFRAAALPLTLFIVQLAANALWSWLFFVWKRGALAFAEVLVLWVLIAATLATFRRVRPLAAGLLVPYLAWVTFATALTYAVWQRNPSVLG